MLAGKFTAKTWYSSDFLGAALISQRESGVGLNIHLKTMFAKTMQKPKIVIDSQLTK